MGDILFQPATWVVALVVGVASAVYLFRTLKAWALLAFLPGLAVIVCSFAVLFRGVRWDVYDAYNVLGAFLAVLLAAVAYPFLLAATALLVFLFRAVILPLGRSRLLVLGGAFLALTLVGAAAVGLKVDRERRRDALIQAITRGDLEYVRAHVRERADAEPDDRYGSPLSFAAESGQPRIVEYLLGKGVAASGGALESVLDSRASQHGPEYDEVVELLLDHGAPVSDLCVLRLFEMKTRGRSVAALRRRFLGGKRMPQDDPAFQAFILGAAFSGEEAIVREYLDRGGDVDLRTPDDVPLVVQAMAGSCDRLVRDLMGRGADPTVHDSGGADRLPTDAGDYLGRLELETVDLVLARIPALNLRRSFRGSPLGEAIDRGRLDVAERLWKAGVDPEQALEHAIEAGARQQVAWLLAHGAAADAPDRAHSRLLAAFLHHHLEIARILLAGGASVRPDEAGDVLKHAIRTGDLDLVKLVVRRGALRNVCTDYEVQVIVSSYGDSAIHQFLLAQQRVARCERTSEAR